MRVNFLLAEEVRREASNKLTILGLFPGDTIIMLTRRASEGVSADTPAGLERLTILATISDAPDGMHTFRGRIYDPSGRPFAPEVTFGEATTKKGYSHTVVIESKPFIVKQPGTFRLEFFVDTEMFAYQFELREQDQP